MKNFQKLSVVLVVILLFSCGGGSSDGDDGGGQTEHGDLFYSAATDTLPTFSTATAADVRNVKSDSWTWGNVAYELFVTFQDYDYTEDQSGEFEPGLNNIYKAIYQASQFYGEAVQHCEETNELTVETTIQSPFDFGETETYTCAYNDTTWLHGNAIKEVDGVDSGLLSWEVVDIEESTDEYGVMQANFDETSGDLSLNMATMVNNSNDGSVYSLRTEIVGNTLTNEFTLRLMKYGGEGYYWISLVGQGISRGDGNYFLFKVNDAHEGNNRYHCFPALADEATLMAEDDAGSDVVSAECASYEATVDALTPFEPEDVATVVSDFNVGNAQAGTIYLNY